MPGAFATNAQLSCYALQTTKADFNFAWNMPKVTANSEHTVQLNDMGLGFMLRKQPCHAMKTC